MSETKKCPFCAEDIQKEAIFCKYCKSDLSEGKKIDKEKVTDNQTSIISLKGELSSQKLLIFNSEYDKKKKSSLVAYLLFLFFFGVFGSHQMYLGNKKMVKKYWTAILSVIIGCIFLSVSDSALVGGFFAALCLIPGGLFWLVFCVSDLFSLGSQTDEANKNIELEILSSLSK